MTTLVIELPDELAEEASSKGLLTPSAIEAMIRDTLRRDAVAELFKAMDKLAASNFPPMTLTEIQKEVDAIRREKGRRASGA